MAQFSKLQFVLDRNSKSLGDTGLPRDNEQAFQFLLTIDTEQTLTIPEWAFFAEVTVGFDSNVWVRQGSVAVTKPVAAAPVAQSSRLINYKGRIFPVTKGSTLRFISGQAAEVNVIFYTDLRGNFIG